MMTRWLAWYRGLQISPHPRRERRLADWDKDRWEKDQKRNGREVAAIVKEV